MSIVLNASKQALISMASAGFGYLVGDDSSTSVTPFLFFTSYHLAKKITLHNTCLETDIPKEICNFVFFTFFISFMYNLWFFYSTALSFNVTASARISLDLTKFLSDSTSNALYYVSQYLVDLGDKGLMEKGVLASELINDLKVMYQNGLAETVSFSFAAAALLSGKMEVVKNISKNLDKLANVEPPLIEKATSFFDNLSKKFHQITDNYFQPGNNDEIIIVDDDLSKALTIYQSVDTIPPHAIQTFTVNSVQTMLTSLNASILGDMSKAIDIMNIDNSLTEMIKIAETQAKGITEDDNIFVRYWKNFKYALDPNAFPLLLAAIPNLVEGMFDKFQLSVNSSEYESIKRFVNDPEFDILKNNTINNCLTSISNAKVHIQKSKYETFKKIEYQQGYGLQGVETLGLGTLSKISYPLITVSGAEIRQSDITIGISLANMIGILFIFGWLALVFSRKGKRDSKKIQQLQIEEKPQTINLLELDIPEDPSSLYVKFSDPFLAIEELPEPISIIQKVRRKRPLPEEMEEGEYLDSDVDYYD